ncbi:hypothetical protein [Aporhodopirellula aestuarii]|uniref:Uncharacterized protein n=1 Tax=Aporhodopirellula aestuarii TaxID=2950107 RepID=A0ABT0U6I7_9BACT|nr:hypothetical protein [Aporhodopirellula aestuarii]MCM2372456.1 hypothetical protein [Aporhodopirellula aestuarii]
MTKYSRSERCGSILAKSIRIDHHGQSTPKKRVIVIAAPVFILQAASKFHYPE